MMTTQEASKYEKAYAALDQTVTALAIRHHCRKTSYPTDGLTFVGSLLQKDIGDMAVDAGAAVTENLCAVPFVRMVAERLCDEIATRCLDECGIPDDTDMVEYVYSNMKSALEDKVLVDLKDWRDVFDNVVDKRTLLGAATLQFLIQGHMGEEVGRRIRSRCLAVSRVVRGAMA